MCLCECIYAHTLGLDVNILKVNLAVCDAGWFFLVTECGLINLLKAVYQ